MYCGVRQGSGRLWLLCKPGFIGQVRIQNGPTSTQQATCAVSIAKQLGIICQCEPTPDVPLVDPSLASASSAL